MTNLYARAVFFVENAGRSQRFYLDELGFSDDWSYNEGDSVYVCQVGLMGCEVILQQVDEDNRERAGHGRIFVGLEDDQIPPVLEHIAARKIRTERRRWGEQTLVIKDPDGNELFFWDWPDKRKSEE